MPVRHRRAPRAGRVARARLLGVLAVLGLLLASATAVGLQMRLDPTTEPGPTAGQEPTETATTVVEPPPVLTPEPPTADPRPLDGLHLVLDPGHNGGNAAAPAEVNRQVGDGRGGTKACNTVGTSTPGGYPEHAFAWDVAVRARELLEAQGAGVTLTREDDDGVGPCVDERGRSAQEAGADLLVSLHANGSENAEVQGYFAIVSSPPAHEAQGEPSRELAGHLLDALGEAGFTPSTALADPITPRADIATLNWSERPAVLLELAEMRNPEEAALAESEEGRLRYAEAIAAGIAGWAETRGGS